MRAREEAGPGLAGLPATGAVPACQPAWPRTREVQSRAGPDRGTLDLDHVLFSDSCFNVFETLTRRPWLRWEEGAGSVEAEGGDLRGRRQSQGLGVRSWPGHIVL